MAALLAATLLGAAPQEKAEELESARAAIQKWVETRQLIAQERAKWAEGKELLADRVELLQDEIASLREKISGAQESITEADRKREGLVEENEALKQVAAVLESTVVALEARTRELLPRLPDPIRATVKPLSQLLPDADGQTRLSVSERFQSVIGILNLVNKFDREITLTSEVRQMPDGTSAEVTAVYLGLGLAYYVNGSGTIAGVGAPSAEGWAWKPASEFAPQISRVIKILQSEEPASFVNLPVAIQ